jgi:hypothetical protein
MWRMAESYPCEYKSATLQVVETIQSIRGLQEVSLLRTKREADPHLHLVSRVDGEIRHCYVAYDLSKSKRIKLFALKA